MTMRIPVERLDDEVRKRLAAGECVEVEEGGEVVARLEPATREPAPKGSLAAFLEARKGDPPLDYDDFLRDLEEIRAELNRPVREIEWD